MFRPVGGIDSSWAVGPSFPHPLPPSLMDHSPLAVMDALLPCPAPVGAFVAIPACEESRLMGPCPRDLASILASAAHPRRAGKPAGWARMDLHSTRRDLDCKFWCFLQAPSARFLRLISRFLGFPAVDKRSASME
jgi:hypothetical protein